MTRFEVKKERTIVITIGLPESLLDELEKTCLERKLCRSEVIRELLKKEFKKNDIS